MLVDISSLPNGASLPVSLSEMIHVPPEYALAFNDVTVGFEGSLVNSGSFYLLEGNATTVLQAECDKCLQPLKCPLAFTVTEKFRRRENDVDDDYWYFDGNIIDLMPALETNLFISIPIRFLCMEGCKGLCFVCGQNLNRNECPCSTDRAESPFDILRSLFNE